MLYAKSTSRSTSISRSAVAEALILNVRPISRIPGKGSPGMPISKRVMEPVVTEPMTSAVRERVPSIEVLKSIIHYQEG